MFNQKVANLIFSYECQESTKVSWALGWDSPLNHQANRDWAQHIPWAQQRDAALPRGRVREQDNVDQSKTQERGDSSLRHPYERERVIEPEGGARGGKLAASHVKGDDAAHDGPDKKIE
jgi:hypothetical protein